MIGCKTHMRLPPEIDNLEDVKAFGLTILNVNDPPPDKSPEVITENKPEPVKEPEPVAETGGKPSIFSRIWEGVDDD